MVESSVKPYTYIYIIYTYLVVPFQKLGNIVLFKKMSNAIDHEIFSL